MQQMTEVQRVYRDPDFAAVQEEADSLVAAALLETADVPVASRAAVALALWQDRTVSVDELLEAARERLAPRRPQLHTFVPLYTTNHCDAECKMCAMRRSNTRLERKFATRGELEEQLNILYDYEGVRGVGLLTGEYEDEHTRMASAFRIGWAARTALDMGFERVYVNIGSMVPHEIEVLGDWFSPEEAVTMCVFQETYDRESYARFMGVPENSPKGNYDRRIQSFDHWLDAGFRYVNPGFLVGVHMDVGAEIVSLVSHASHLRERGAVVDLSLPRMRPAMSTSNRTRTRVGDEDYLRSLAAIALACPDQRLVLTTREDQDFQDVAIGLAGVMSPGSPDVAPYRRDSTATNADETSQFRIADLRRPRDILSRIQSRGIEIDCFVHDDADAAAY